MKIDKKPFAVYVTRDELAALFQFHSKDETRAHMNGVTLRHDGLYATDGHTLCAAQWKPTAKAERQIIIPGKNIKAWLAATPRGGDLVLVPSDPKGAQWRQLAATIRGRDRKAIFDVTVRGCTTASAPPFEAILKPAKKRHRNGYQGFNAEYLGRLAAVQNALALQGCMAEVAGDLTPSFFRFDKPGNPWTVVLMPIRMPKGSADV